MEKYESKQVQVNKPAWMIYNTLSDFTHFTPIVADKVEGWQATADSCTFKIKGFNVKLVIVEREEFKLIKITGEDGTPFDFTFWIQLREIDQTDTRLRLVLHAKLNMMMKMMVGGKIQTGLDTIAEQIAASFNRAPFA